jgi:ABC-type glycerol-3-phosphate transport system substrate-binding protein
LARGISNPALQQGRDVGAMYEIVAAPKVMADTMPSYVGEAGWGFAAPRKAKNLDLAVAFLQMMATEEAQTIYCTMYGGITAPAWKALLGKIDHFADPKPDGANAKAAQVMKPLGELTHFYGEGFGYPAEVDNIGAELCSKVRVGDMTAAEGAQAYQERCEAQFKQYQEDVQNS